MATAKQRARRAKEKRHGIEIVEIDEEGNERVLGRDELKAADPPARTGTAKGASPGTRASRRGAPQPPSWQRALKRAGIFAPIFFVFVLLTSKDRNVAGALLTVALLAVVFVPMSYVMDRWAYRMYQKRVAKDGGRGRR